MLAVQGYFDGEAIRPLEKIVALPNQRVIITVMDEFIEPERVISKHGMRGILAQFADPVFAQKEKGAWALAAEEKHGNS